MIVSTTVITLKRALEKRDVPGRADIWSDLGKIFLTSVNAWYPAHPDLVLSVGKTYTFRDRDGFETVFIA